MLSYTILKGGERMLVETVKLNAVSISYETLSDLGKKVNRRQSFDIMSLTANNQDFFDVANAISNFLAYVPKEITKNLSILLSEG